MLIFEGYFGISIKFLNPVLLMWNLASNLRDDIYPTDLTIVKDPAVQVWASFWMVIAFLLVIVPFITCSHPEVFEHNVNLEFLADNLYEIKLRMARYLKEQIKASMANKLKGKLNLNVGASNSAELNTLIGKSPE